jgi:hypothetical protein
MARLYRKKVTNLAKRVERPDRHTEAAEAICDLIDAIVLIPADRFRPQPDATEDGTPQPCVPRRATDAGRILAR